MPEEKITFRNVENLESILNVAKSAAMDYITKNDLLSKWEPGFQVDLDEYARDGPDFYAKPMARIIPKHSSADNRFEFPTEGLEIITPEGAHEAETHAFYKPPVTTEDYDKAVLVLLDHWYYSTPPDW